MFVSICAMFIVIGLWKHGDKNVRWLIAAGMGGLGEVLLRWLLELYHDRWAWLGLRRAENERLAPYDLFFSESRFTKAVRMVAPNFATRDEPDGRGC